jgi:hypothetical protein
MAQKHTCALCGGPVGEDGRTLASTPLVRMEPRQAAAFASSAPPADDPLQHLTPVERYARAIERRNILIRDRRTSGRPAVETLISIPLPTRNQRRPRCLTAASQRRAQWPSPRPLSPFLGFPGDVTHPLSVSANLFCVAHRRECGIAGAAAVRFQFVTFTIHCLTPWPSIRLNHRPVFGAPASRSYHVGRSATRWRSS